MASKQTLRKFAKSRETHYRTEREKEAERKHARLKGFAPASMADMTTAVLGLQPGQSKAESLAERVAQGMNRAERRARGIR